MADTPTPRSVNQIIGDQVDAFLTDTGLPKLKVGNPILSIFEATAQSQFKNSGDIFKLLSSNSLQNATGTALLKIGRDENVPQITQTNATGTVTITDVSFTKKSSKIFQGTAAPVVGSTTINVQDASTFTPTGSIYIGRNTSNNEGPLAYTSILPPGIGGGFSGGSYYSIILSSGTVKFHNLNESVILAQGGLRSINAGTVVQTPQGSNVLVPFSLVYSATIQDGETVVENVQVRCKKPGTVGNVSAGAIKEFASAPFSGATVTNPLPFTNGLPTETDDAYRQRIQNARQSRAKATALAIQTNTLGITAQDENKRVLSTNIIDLQDEPVLVVIDDGNGYEEINDGNAIEVLTDYAIGGERYFKTSEKPITKAFLKPNSVSPFELSEGIGLAFNVGGITTEVTFQTSQFRSIANATSFEICSAITGTSGLNWSAKTVDDGDSFIVFGKEDFNEDIQWVDTGDNDSNISFDFPAGRKYSVFLYKNDRLLTKDGQLASVYANPFAAWANFSGDQTLELEVDGISLNFNGIQFPSFTAQDFIDAATGYTSVAKNSSESWVKVLNYKIPGITATLDAGLIVFTSNKGRSSDASVRIVSGTLVANSMFAAQDNATVGKDSDFTLNRNTGELKLASVLEAGDRLTLGSENTRAFLESPTITTFSLGFTSLANIGQISRAATTVTVNTATAHGLSIGDSFTLSPGEANFPAGIKKVVGVGSATQFTYTESGAATVSTVQQTISRNNYLWFSVDADAAAVQNGVTSSTSIDITSSAESWGYRVTLTTAGDSFTNVERGDWVVLSDPSFGILAPGAYRIIESDDDYIMIERPYTVTATVLPIYSGFYIVRANKPLVPVNIPSGVNYTPHTLSDAINADMDSAYSTVFRTTKVRVATNTFDLDIGDIALVATDYQTDFTQLPISDAIENSTDHFASVEAGNDEAGTPNFAAYLVDSFSAENYTDFSLTGTAAFDLGSILLGLRAEDEGYFVGEVRWGQNYQFRSPALSSEFSGGFYDTVLENGSQYGWMLEDRLAACHSYAITPDDTLGVLFDNDELSRRYIINMFRHIKPTTGTYGITNEFVDADNANNSLVDLFGTDFNFVDFSVNIGSRTITHVDGDTDHYATGIAPYDDIVVPSDSTATILWKYYRNGGDGEGALLQYAYPDEAGQDPTISISNSSVPTISVVLPSGTERTGYGLRNASHLGYAVKTLSNGLSDTVLVSHLFISSATRVGTTVTLTLTLPVGLTDHGFQTGNSLYVNSADIDFPGGQFTITFVSATQISYTQAGAATTVANIGTISYDNFQEVTFGGGSIANDDFLHFNSDFTTFLPPEIMDTTFRIASYQDDYIRFLNPNGPGVNTAIFWCRINIVEAVSFFQNPKDTAQTILTAIDTFNDDNPDKAVISGTLLGDGTGTIWLSTHENALDTSIYFVMADGVNYIASQTVGANYSFTFKKDVDSFLAANDVNWENEEVTICPTTSKNVVDWLNSQAVSGFFTSGFADLSTSGTKPQIASLQIGNDGSVEVLGGLANSWSANIYGTAEQESGNMLVKILNSNSQGIRSGEYVSLQNANPLPKPIFTSLTELDSITADGVFTFDNGTPKVWTQIQNCPEVFVQIDKVGKFLRISDLALEPFVLTSVSEGDWVYLETAPPSLDVPIFDFVINALNTGYYRVVRVEIDADAGATGMFWIENPTGVEQEIAYCDIKFIDKNSTLPGDTLQINGNYWGGSANRGNWTVDSIDFTNQWSFTVDTSSKALTAGTGFGALGATNAGLTKMVEGTPTRLIKKVTNVSPSSVLTDSFTVLTLESNECYELINATGGTVVAALDKLAFPITTAKGVDGYRFSTGLVGETNRVLYGDPADFSTYPGVIAAGSQINIEGPTIKRLSISVQLRVKSGFSKIDIENQAKSTIASVINSSISGQSIAISSYVSELQKISGIEAITPLNPQLVNVNDRIPIQPFERPKILNLDEDISISFIE